MGEISYKPLIDDMVWSFSRLDSYGDCPYRWFLRYIKRHKETDKFYASYGSFMHKILERYYSGELTKDGMLSEFLLKFSDEVKGIRPKETTVQKYIEQGSEYLRNFQPLPFKMISVENKVEFDIDGIPFVGFIDFLGEEDGEYIIVDNKSRDLKPRSKRAKPTVKDRELDEMLKQLYIYSAAVYQKYGKYPKELCFNCFRTGTLIREPFNIEAYNSAIQWAKDRIEEISNDADFLPNQDFFACRYICGVSDDCIYDIEAYEERVWNR